MVALRLLNGLVRLASFQPVTHGRHAFPCTAYHSFSSHPNRPTSTTAIQSVGRSIGSHHSHRIESADRRRGGAIMAKKNFYAVAVGKRPGIYSTWPECRAQTNGFKGAVFKGFATRSEAEEFVSSRGGGKSRGLKGDSSSKSSSSSSPSGQQNAVASAPACRPRPPPPAAVAPDGPLEQRRLEDDHVEVKQPSKRMRLTSPPHRRRVSFVVHFDGGSRGNPGRVAGAGAEIVMRRRDEGRDDARGASAGDDSCVLIEKRKFFEQQTSGCTSNTNNVAEYEGLILGLQEAKQRAEGSLDEIVASCESPADATGEQRRVTVELSLRVFGDSQLIINQMRGRYECRSANIRPLYERASRLAEAWHRLQGHGKSNHSLKMDISSTIEYEHVYRKDNAAADRLANEAMDEERSWTTVHESGAKATSAWV